MQDDGDEDVRQQLYDRFRESLGKPVDERYFEEDELVYIFDYAGDMNDDYVRAEVLFCGERLYPGSDALRARRSILYSECMPGANAFAGYVRDNASSGDSIIWKIESTLDEFPQGGDARGRLDALLASKDTFDDEELIRLVKLAQSLSCRDWLLDNIDGLRRHAAYLPVLLYELGSVFMDAGDYGHAGPFLEALTRLEPFEATYWAMLFAVLVHLERYDDAREAFEFASGLEISDSETAVLLATPVADESLADLRPQICAILEKVLRREPDYYRLVDALATQYAGCGKKAEAFRVLSDYAEIAPRVRETALLAMELELDDFDVLFTMFMEATNGTGYTHEEVMHCLYGLFEARRYADVRRLTDAYLKYAAPTDELRALYTEASFLVHDYQSCLEMQKDTMEVLSLMVMPSRGARAAYIYYTSLVAVGRADEASHFAVIATVVIRSIISAADVYDRLLLRGLLAEFGQTENPQ